jgi:hypothetical protein
MAYPVTHVVTLFEVEFLCRGAADQAVKLERERRARTCEDFARNLEKNGDNVQGMLIAAAFLADKIRKGD